MKNGRISLWKVKILPAVMANGTRGIQIMKIPGKNKMIIVAIIQALLIVHADLFRIIMPEIQGQETVLTDLEEILQIQVTAL